MLQVSLVNVVLVLGKVFLETLIKVVIYVVAEVLFIKHVVEILNLENDVVLDSSLVHVLDAMVEVVQDYFR